jgi:hypothetical protein
MMKKRLLMIGIITIGIMLSSCSTGIVNVVVTPPTKTGINTTTTNVLTDTPLVINTKEDLLKSTADLTYPSAITFNNYIPGVNEYLWMLDDKTPVFGHNAGDVMCIDIYNYHDENAVFSIQYADTPAEDTFDGGTIKYQPEPDAVSWVTIKYQNINVEAHQLIGIPISLDVPVGTQLPAHWEFRITVTDDTFLTQYSGNSQVRVLVNTAQP